MLLASATSRYLRFENAPKSVYYIVMNIDIQSYTNSRKHNILFLDILESNKHFSDHVSELQNYSARWVQSPACSAMLDVSRQTLVKEEKQEALFSTC